MIEYYCNFCGFDSAVDDDNLCECRCHLIDRGVE